jgi:hypothetical protein
MTRAASTAHRVKRGEWSSCWLAAMLYFILSFTEETFLTGRKMDRYGPDSLTDGLYELEIFHINLPLINMEATIIYFQKSVADPLHEAYLPGYSKSIRATPQLTKKNAGRGFHEIDENRDLKISILSQ